MATLTLCLPKWTTWSKIIPPIFASDQVVKVAVSSIGIYNPEMEQLWS